MAQSGQRGFDQTEMKYILALDQGTTSSRAILFNVEGQIVAIAQKELKQYFPDNGLVEHDPIEIWEDQLEVARQAISYAKIKPQHIAAIGITNQRETTVLWDRKTGLPLARAIVWQDRRTADKCAQIKAEGHAELIQQTTGLVPDAYFSATKLQWLMDNIPQARERAKKGELAFGTVDSWLAFKLTGGKVHATDVSNASRTLLFNIHELQWDPALLELFDIPKAVLPEVFPSSGIIGHTPPELLGAEIPIAAMVGDQQAATFGQTCFQTGMVKNTYGTGCFLLLQTGQSSVSSPSSMLKTVGWQLGPQQPASYCLEGSIFMAGATVQWLRDCLHLFEKSEDIEPLAASVPDTGDLFLVPALTGLGAPYWDPHARGLMIGMTRATTKAHIARAALESIALQVTEVLHAMQEESGTPISELRVDGGACRNNLLMQMQADLCGHPVVRPKITETTALGAAYLAGLSCGIWPDLSFIASHWQVDRTFEPCWSEDRRLTYLERWRLAVSRSQKWARH